MVDVDFAKIEKKWQGKWAREKVFEVKDSGAKKYYVLEMFPYPSGSGLHMGHAWNYTIGDILARFKMMQGFNVLHPMGYDSLGLPAENAAIESGEHPEDYTKKSVANFTKQFKSLGISYDWSRMVNTSDPSYYRWDQWIFLKMLEKGLAYQKESEVNWCKKCNTVLANEQVHDGKCWRHEDVVVETRKLKQWFFKTTEYADELYSNLENMDWPERTKAMQRNWIGKSHGTEIDFSVEGNVGNVVIVHGANDGEKEAFEGGRENTRHWFPWLKKVLKEKKIEVSGELYPQDWNPDYEEWKKIFEKNDINQNTILVGHSLGCGFVLRWLSENKIKVKKVILVAPYVLDSKELPGLKDMVNFEFGEDLNEYFDDLVVFYSDNDNERIIKGAKAIREKLEGDFIECKGKGHFCKSNGFDEFPDLLEKINSNGKWSIFTTRPDTIFGVTFMVVSAAHSRLDELVTDEQRKDVDKFLKKLKSVSEKDPIRYQGSNGTGVDKLDKEGVFSGSYAINPANGEKVPVWIGNFVVADYGAGMVMAVPAHDQRDFDFAKKYKIEIRQVISGEVGDTRAWTYDGKLMGSGKFNGLDNQEAKKKISDWLIKKKTGRKVVNFKLRDWGVSRQRYWGTPIPIIHCEKCGAVPVPEKDLPVKLPKDVKFGKGNPLETNEKWLSVKCPKCGGKGRRESDTMDTFVNSSWYFLRYCDPNNAKKIFDPKKVKYWCPVDTYIGGAEHACMHLIYSRFYVKFLRDLGLVDFDEPAVRLFHQGMLHGENGEKMSKSKGNGVLPEEVSSKYGIDTARFFLSGIASPDKNIDWSEKGINGSLRFINNVIGLYSGIKIGKDSDEVLSKLNETVKNVGAQIDSFDYRTATIRLKELFDLLAKQKTVTKATMGSALKMLAPFCPHVAEELWEKMGNKDFVSVAAWPNVDESKIVKKGQGGDLNEKIIEDVNRLLEKVAKGDGARSEERGARGAGKVYVYVMPFELVKVDVKKIGKATGKDVKVFAVNDSGKYDPEGKVKRAKPGKASVYVE